MLTWSKITEESAIRGGAIAGRVLDLSLSELGYTPAGHGEREGIRLAGALWRQAWGQESPAAVEDTLNALARLRQPRSKESAAAEVLALRKDLHTREASPLVVLGQTALARAALAREEFLYLAELAALAEVTPAALLYLSKAGKLELWRPRPGEAARIKYTNARAYLGGKW